MKINHVIHTPWGQKILAQSITGSGVCQGVMSDSQKEGFYPPLHRIQFPTDSVVEDLSREIRVAGERRYQSTHSA